MIFSPAGRFGVSRFWVNPAVWPGRLYWPNLLSKMLEEDSRHLHSLKSSWLRGKAPFVWFSFITRSSKSSLRGRTSIHGQAHGWFQRVYQDHPGPGVSWLDYPIAYRLLRDVHWTPRLDDFRECNWCTPWQCHLWVTWRKKTLTYFLKIKRASCTSPFGDLMCFSWSPVIDHFKYIE